VFEPKFDPEKRQGAVMTQSGPQVFTSLAGVQASKLDPEKSQSKVALTSDFLKLTGRF